MKRKVFMAMRLRMFFNILKKGFQNITRNKGLGIAAISSISATLVILGIVLVVILNVNGLAVSTQKSFDQVQIYLKDNLSQENLNSIESKIKAVNGTGEVSFETKEEALKSMKESWGESGELLEGMEDAVSESFYVKIEDLETSESIVSQLGAIEGVEEVIYEQDTMAKLLDIANYIRWAGFAIIGLLMLISVFIVSNTIKITVAARRKEIEIMKYVGATNGFVRGPFIIEGIVLGIIGTLVSAGIVYGGYTYLHANVSKKLYATMSFNLISPNDIVVDLIILFTAIGIGVGIIGSVMSLRKYLRV